MRQAGILAAAGIHALRHHVDRLHEDHAKATRVAQALARLPAFQLKETPQTNMVMLAEDCVSAELTAHLAGHGIRVSGARWVFHLDVSEAHVDHLVDVCERFDRGLARAAS